jgi:hypothetical protein
MDLATMIPDGRRDATDVEFVLLHITGIAVLADTIKFGLQLLQISRGVRRQPL